MTEKTKNIFSCGKCGTQYAKWQGRCTECGSWSTIAEETITIGKMPPAAVLPSAVIDLASLPHTDETRLTTGSGEFDRVLGGGIVKGSFILLGGDPGIGKSTLALMLSGKLSQILYVSGEESPAQVKMRAERLNINLSSLKFLSETDVDKIVATAKEHAPILLIIDSIQTIHSSEANGSAGSVGQITAAAAKLMELAKSTEIAVLIIGHVTKDGLVAGPKTLEHLVDTVMYLENDDRNLFRILRTIKNRFGEVGEIGIFEMTAAGLKEIADPSSAFISKGQAAPGTASTIIMEGSRPFAAEIQTLAAKTYFGFPQRRAGGFDLNRLQMLIAVLGQYAKNAELSDSGVNFSSADIYLNVAGGIKIKETGADLAAAAALISAIRNQAIPDSPVIIGEIGLSGEIRSVPNMDRRLKEAKKIGFSSAIIPVSAKTATIPALKLTRLANIAEISSIFNK